MAVFGNTLASVDFRGVSPGIFRGAIGQPPADGTVNSITFRLEGTGGTWQAMIYNGGTLVAASAVRSDISSVADYAFTFAGESISAATTYRYAIGNAGVADGVVYDNGTGQAFDGTSTDNFFSINPPTASGVTWETDSSHDYGFQVDYTAAGGFEPAWARNANSVIQPGRL